MKHDTAQIRFVARKIQNCALSVSDVSTREVRPLRERVLSEFEGEAANALTARLEALQGDVEKLGKGIDSVYRELMSYARRLEIADEQSKMAIQNK
ncbi:MAG: hypothetical protein Q4D04_14690 [Clostridia bacterium]|nr:hypothetical protein [Clostridia bacterium]